MCCYSMSCTAATKDITRTLDAVILRGSAKYAAPFIAISIVQWELFIVKFLP